MLNIVLFYPFVYFFFALPRKDELAVLYLSQLGVNQRLRGLV